jgi:hypothetical protein
MDVMWIAETSVEDGIAIVVFATVVFLILLGFVAMVRWLARVVSGRPAPVKMETVLLVLDYEFEESEDEVDPSDDDQEINRFVMYLNSIIAEFSAGHVTEVSLEGDEMTLSISGPDAKRIWELLSTEVTNFSPHQPKRVIFERSKKKGGNQTLEEIQWNPGATLDFQLPPEVEIPESWVRLANAARVLSLFGVIGLFAWNASRSFLGKSEGEFMDTAIGMTSAYLVGIPLVFGLALALICSIRIKAITKAAGFDDLESSISRTLKYVLLIVIAIFATLLVVTTFLHG